ncbi:MAG: exodeoxyribonuclease V subunit gamma [Simkaniaceae bacterium]
MSPRLLTSNSYEALANELFKSLYSSFGRKFIVVPSEEVKSYLEEYAVQQEGLFFGVSFCSLNQLISELLNLIDKPYLSPSSTELALLIESELGLSETIPTKKRRRDLADLYSRLFLRYGREGCEAFLKWKKGKSCQSKLYRNIFSKWDDLSTFYSNMNWPEKTDFSLEIHIFGLSTLKEVYFSYFREFGRLWPTALYFFNPTEAFIGEDSSEKLLRKQMKGAESEAILEEINLRNPLLANLGKMGRFLQNRLLDEGYHEETLFFHNEEPKTQLAALQRELFENIPCQNAKKDESIVLHSCPSSLREIEVLKMVVENLLHRDPNLQPSEILVMAPQIEKYLAHIELTFANSSIPYTVKDLPLKNQQESYQAFLYLLQMAQSGLEKSTLLKFLDFSCVRQAKGLYDLEKIVCWLEKARVFWGLNLKERDKALSRFNEEEKMIDRSQKGTWEEGLFHLLMGLVMPSEEESPYYPAEILDFSEAEELGQLIQLIEELACFFEERSKGEKTIEGWKEFLEHNLKKFIDKGDEMISPLFKEFAHLVQKNPELTFEFESIQQALIRALNRRSGQITHSDQNALSFLALKAGRCRPAKVVYLMGMENFPSGESKTSLDELPNSGPSLIDEDRFLFLELISSSKDYFMLSYSSLSLEDGKPQPLGSLVEELKLYLGGRLNTYTHPAYRFHPSYFQKEADFKNFSLKDFQALTGEKKKPSFPQFMKKASSLKAISTKDLHRLAKNPLQFFLNNSLGIYLPFIQEDEEPEFSPTLLDRARLKQLTLEGGKLSLNRFMPLAPWNALVDREVQVEESFRFELSQAVEKFEQISDHFYLFPSIKIDNVEIFGPLPPVSKEGLLVYGKKSRVEKLKIWPLFCIYNLLPLDSLGFSPVLKFFDAVEAFEGSPYEEIRKYITYYEEALATPSPYYPDLVKPLLIDKKSPLELLKKKEGDRHYLWLKNQGAFLDWDFSFTLPGVFDQR